jgi:hypothetical protein
MNDREKIQHASDDGKEKMYNYVWLKFHKLWIFWNSEYITLVLYASIEAHREENNKKWLTFPEMIESSNILKKSCFKRNINKSILSMILLCGADKSYMHARTAHLC